jgi:hypothetical protein
MLAADSVLSGSFPARAFIAFSFATSPQSPNGLSLGRWQQAKKKRNRSCGKLKETHDNILYRQ